MKKYSHLFFALIAPFAFAACDDCTQTVEARPGQTIFYQNEAKENFAVQVPEDGKAEIPCDAQTVTVVDT